MKDLHDPLYPWSLKLDNKYQQDGTSGVEEPFYYQSH